MNHQQIWGVLQCILLISQSQNTADLIHKYGFNKMIAQSGDQLFLYLKDFKLIGDVFPKLKTRSLPPAKSFEIPFNKIKPGDFK